jgi:hypothetical protein
MGIFKIISWIISFIVICLLIYGGLYAYSLSKIEVVNVRVDSLQDVSLSGFTLGGEIDVYNGGVLKVSVSQITYSLDIDGSEKQLTSGIIKGAEIPAKDTVSFLFSSRVNWTPTAEIAWNLITPGKTYATLSGTVYAADLGFIYIKTHFEKKVDLEDYISQFAKNQPEGTAEKVTGAVTDVIEKIGEGLKTVTGNIVRGVGNLIS